MEKATNMEEEHVNLIWSISVKTQSTIGTTLKRRTLAWPTPEHKHIRRASPEQTLQVDASKRQ
jgi:hypothetical protein